ncbi:MAG: BolA/IbaG family iron-sulfur metabolism protein [Pseudomonadales bacterium]|nr:BolA/IbaG family iron-sulfur metabolism protein [Pseudomonadales bacterium]
MDAGQIQDILAEALPDCEIRVSGEGGKYQVLAVGEVFKGLNPVKRQQTIYQILNPHIASGAIHAVSMRLLTVDEKAALA